MTSMSSCFCKNGFDEIKAIVRKHYRLVNVVKGEKVLERKRESRS